MSRRVGCRWHFEDHRLRHAPGPAGRPRPEPRTLGERLAYGWEFVRLHLLPYWMLWVLRQSYRVLRSVTPELIQRALVRACCLLGVNFGDVRLQMRETLIDRRQTAPSGWALPLLGTSLLLHWLCRRVAGASGSGPGSSRLLERWMRRIERKALWVDEQLWPKAPSWLSAAAYRAWLLAREPDEMACHEQRAEPVPGGATISVLTVLLEAREDPLLGLLNTVMQQSHAGWELVVVDATGDPAVASLFRAACGSHPAVTVLSADPGSGIADLLTRALEAATGEFQMILDLRDRLAPSCLYAMAAEIATHPDSDLLYADEDWIDRDGLRSRPHFKPDYSPETLRSFDMIGRPCLVRRSLVHRVGGYRSAHQRAVEYDLNLRICELTDQVRHLPQVLYHWRLGDSEAGRARSLWSGDAAAALAGHLERTGQRAVVERGLLCGAFDVRYALEQPPRVTIVIPNRDQREMLRACVSSVLERTDYPDYEIVIVENGSREGALFEDYEAYRTRHPDRVRVVTWQGPFNFSRVINHGVEHATGDMILMLNNDTEVIHADWLERLCALAVRPGVGVVGAKLYFSSGAVQHGGVVVGLGGGACHPHRCQPGDAAGHMGRLGVTAELSAVTGACLMISRRILEALGGLDPAYPLSFNDIDLCLRVREAGYRVIWTPHVQLYHHESVTRGRVQTEEQRTRADLDVARFQRDWGRLIRRGDPFYNPNLSMLDDSVALKQHWEDAYFAETVPDLQRSGLGALVP